MSKQYIVRMECKVIKEVVCEGCTAAQAAENPWDHAVDEREVEQVDWEVSSVREEEKHVPKARTVADDIQAFKNQDPSTTKLISKLAGALIKGEVDAKIDC